MIYLSGQHYNARDIVQNIFSPLVGVITSPLADEVCQRNNLSFVELLQPFAKLQTADAQFRDVSGTSVSIRGLRLNFCDIDWRPPQPMLARKMLNETVTNATAHTNISCNIAGEDIQVPTDHPWFEQWRETFLNVQFPADHEFTRHFISCVVVLCSSDPNIIETAHKLTLRMHETQMTQPQRLPKWFHTSNVLNNYVVLHEGSTDLLRAQQSFELLRSTFSDTLCFLVQINSLDEAAHQHRITVDHWAPYIQRQPRVKQELDLQLDSSIVSKAMQDSNLPVMLLPTLLADTPLESNDQQMNITHPLSPLQEGVTDTINSKFSASNESIISQNNSTKFWSSELGGDDIRVPVVHGALLNTMDVENLRHFVQDYVVRALIPYVEHQVAVLSESVTNKKGVSKSLLSATKRWFATNKPIGGGNTQNAVIYTHESVELQTRKLADLYFMFGHYNLAYQAYHQAKRDFNADSAWQYYAGALEMAALAAFMTGTANRKTFDYMEEAIQCYLNVCKLPQFATRATLLSTECLKNAKQHTEAAKQLLRMISDDSDLRSALLLEQAAYCFLACAQPASMYRKYAFHIVLAGNRFSRAGQRQHAYRCYKQVQGIFRNRGWYLANDHIRYTLAKQAYTLKKFNEASESIGSLLRTKSAQSAQQQLSFFKEYIQTQLENLKQNPQVSLLTHILPTIVPRSMRLLLAAPQSKATAPNVPATGIDINSDPNEETIWRKIEKMLVASAAPPTRAYVFKPTINLVVSEAHVLKPGVTQPLIAVQGEPIEVCMKLQNPVRFAVTLSKITLLWQLSMDQQAEVLTNLGLYGQSNGGGCDGNETLSKTAIDALINIGTVADVTLGEHDFRMVFFKLTPKLTGMLSIVGLICQVTASTVPLISGGIDQFSNHGTVASVLEPQPNIEGVLPFEFTQTLATSNATKMLRYDDLTHELIDRALSIRILPSQPYLNVEFSSVPGELLAGEIISVTMLVRNMGLSVVENIYCGCECPRWLTMRHDHAAQVPFALMSRIAFKDSTTKLAKDKEIRRQYVYRLHNNKNGTPLNLKAQEIASINMWLQAPYKHGKCTLRLLLYYEIPTEIINVGSGEPLRYRLLRHVWRFNVRQCVRLKAAVVINNVNTNDLALDVVIGNELHEKNYIIDGNLNEGKISELYVTSLSLFSEQLILNSKWFVMNEVGIVHNQLTERCLAHPGSSLSLQCHLSKSSRNDTTLSSTGSLEQWFQQCLSSIDLTNDGRNSYNAPASSADKVKISQSPLALYESHSFLVKNETKFLKSSISPDDFNNIVAEVDSHHTVALCWRALVEKNGDQKRWAHGQHFVQLRRLNEIVCCASALSDVALSKKKFVGYNGLLIKEATPNIKDIIDGKISLQTFIQSSENYWESNTYHVGKRCLLED